MHSFIYYISYCSFPFLAIVTFILFKYRKDLNILLIGILIFLILLSLSFIYARFIERYLIFTKEYTIDVGFSGRIIVIADMHLGVYKDKWFMDRVIEKIKKIPDVDAVLIPGDFTFYPTKDQKLEELFSGFQELSIPVFGVLGNHDSEKPGPPLQKELQAALEKHGLTFLHNTTAKLGNITILGLGDNWAHEDNTALINNFNNDDNLIVITHNPDTTLQYTNGIADLTVSGHTHGGQIRLPFIYKYAIPCTGDFDQGIYDLEHGGKVFVTAGIGEVGLPMRLGIPPTIEVINLK